MYIFKVVKISSKAANPIIRITNIKSIINVDYHILPIEKFCKNSLILTKILTTLSVYTKSHFPIELLLEGYTDKMIFSEETLDYFLLIQSKVRHALAGTKSETPYFYEGECFFNAYNLLHAIWVKRQSQRQTARLYSLSRDSIRIIENNFLEFGAIGLLPDLTFIETDERLEQLSILVKSARPHEHANYTLKLATALRLKDVSLNRIRLIQRCYGYGHRFDDSDIQFFNGLQQILKSLKIHKSKPYASGHDRNNRRETFFNFDKDVFQQRIELFKQLSQCEKKRQVRPTLQQFGIHPNRYYALKDRYMLYGIWGFIDIVHKQRVGEKISPALELQIIEERLMNPKLSAQKMINKLSLKCSRANVQKVYKKWKLSSFNDSICIRGVVSSPIDQLEQASMASNCSARARFPDLIKTAGLKVNRGFIELLDYLKYHRVPISNPGAILLAPFLEQLGIVESLHTYGPESYRTSEITNTVIVNVLRIITGSPTIHDFTMNSDRSVAIGSGLLTTPRKSRFYESFDELRFVHLQKLRRDVAIRAKELGIIDGKEIAIDYHCDPCDSLYPYDKCLSKSPDKNGNLVYAHRPQVIWDSMTNSIINIAYCEGASRAPSALYKFCEENLFNIIEAQVIEEIYADSEYTGEKQLVHLITRSNTHVTMCLKQNKKIKIWKEETLKTESWIPYGEKYRLKTKDFKLAESGKSLRFVVKQNIKTNDVRCFGSTHLDYSPEKILDSYHIRWPVETGIKDLVENYFLDKPTGTSPEKIEAHYYTVMIAKLLFDYFLSIFCETKWKTPEEWECILSTIRTTIFSNQNCELSVNEKGNLMVTYLDGDPMGIKKHLKQVMQKRLAIGLNYVSWWNRIGVDINIKDKFKLKSGL